MKAPMMVPVTVPLDFVGLTDDDRGACSEDRGACSSSGPP
ncbi:hypothetical protein HDC93_007230 [Streptomyces sp. AK010]|nr:hypothetical protein [Streptomyces sp. AK010]